MFTSPFPLGSLGVQTLLRHRSLLGALVFRACYVLARCWEPWCDELFALPIARFCGVLEPSWRSFWGPFGLLLGPFWALSGRLGALWGRLGASWMPLAVLGLSWRPLGAVLGASWGSLGALLGPSWDPLGPSRCPLGPSWGPLGPFSGASGGLLGRLGTIFGASWAVFGRPWPEKARTRKTFKNH